MEPRCNECHELRGEVHALREDVTAIRIRLGWLFGALGLVGAIDWIPR